MRLPLLAGALLLTAQAARAAVSADLGKFFPESSLVSEVPAVEGRAVPGQPPQAAPPWLADAKDLCKVWTARNPRTAEPALCEFAARELRAHGIPWRVALANWDYASSLKPWMKYSAGGMTAEGLTDANWGFCKDHPEAVRGLLGREPRRSDMMNPRASILWWIAEYELEREKLGAGADPWSIAAAVFYPASPEGKRARLEVRRWKRVAAEHERILSER